MGMESEARERELDALLERRARLVGEDRVGQEHANALDEMWAQSERHHHARRREANRLLWQAYYARLAVRLRARADALDAAARALVQEDEPKGAA